MITQLGSFGAASTLVTPLRDLAAQPKAAETLAPPLTAVAVTPPPEAAESRLETSLGDAPRPALLPPDPNAPAGPPPTFEASILDRTREALRAPVDLLAEATANADSTADLYEVPPSRSERAAENVSTLRRIETPYDTATVDVSR